MKGLVANCCRLLPARRRKEVTLLSGGFQFAHDLGNEFRLEAFHDSMHHIGDDLMTVRSGMRCRRGRSQLPAIPTPVPATMASSAFKCMASARALVAAVMTEVGSSDSCRTASTTESCLANESCSAVWFPEALSHVARQHESQAPAMLERSALAECIQRKPGLRSPRPWERNASVLPPVLLPLQQPDHTQPWLRLRGRRSHLLKHGLAGMVWRFPQKHERRKNVPARFHSESHRCPD